MINRGSYALTLSILLTNTQQQKELNGSYFANPTLTTIDTRRVQGVTVWPAPPPLVCGISLYLLMGFGSQIGFP